MFLEYAATSTIINRIDNCPPSMLITDLDIKREEKAQGYCQLTIKYPDVNIDFQDHLNLWLDQEKSIYLGSFIVNDYKIKELPVTQKGVKGKEYTIDAICFKNLLNRKRFSIHKANIAIKTLIEKIIAQGGPDYGVSTSYSYVQDIDCDPLAKYEEIGKTAAEMLDNLYEYGVSWDIDINKVVHAWDSIKKEYAFKATGITINDSTLFLEEFDIGKSAGDGIVNRIKIIGKSQKSKPIYKKITSEGDVLKNLDYPLEFNPFIGNYFIEEWNGLDAGVVGQAGTGIWTEIDPGGSIKTGFDGLGYIFPNEGKVVVWGGTGTLGDVALVRNDYFEYLNDGYIQTSMKYCNDGTAYVCGLTDGNGYKLENTVMAFRVNNHQIDKIITDGSLVTPDNVVNLKNEISSTVSNLSTDRLSFDIQSTYSSQVEIGDKFFMIGANMGIEYVTVTNKSSNTLTIDHPIPESSDITGATLNRDPWYNLRIVFGAESVEFQIQGEDLGQLGSANWTTIHSADNTFDIPKYVFLTQILNDDLQCYFERIIIAPPEECKFTLSDGTIYTISPEEYAAASGSQIVLHPQDALGNPARLSFRAPLFIASVAENSKNSTSTIYYEGKTSEYDPEPGNRIIINGDESYISTVVLDTENEGCGKLVLDSNFLLSAKPSTNDYIYFRTTMLPDGGYGTLEYRFETENKHEFSDSASIALWGVYDGEALYDDNLTSYNDLETKANGIFDLKANPQVSGTLKFKITNNEIFDPGILNTQVYTIPRPGQYFNVASSLRGISTTSVKISSVNLTYCEKDILDCTVVFNQDDYTDTSFDKMLKRRLMDINDKNRILFQSETLSDSIGVVEDTDVVTASNSAFGEFYFNTMAFGTVA